MKWRIYRLNSVDSLQLWPVFPVEMDRILPPYVYRIKDIAGMIEGFDLSDIDWYGDRNPCRSKMHLGLLVRDEDLPVEEFEELGLGNEGDDEGVESDDEEEESIFGENEVDEEENEAEEEEEESTE